MEYPKYPLEIRVKELMGLKDELESILTILITEWEKRMYIRVSKIEIDRYENNGEPDVMTVSTTLEI